jgi:hypothetical protein
MSDDKDRMQDHPEGRAVSSNPDHPPQRTEDTPEQERELLPQDEEEEARSGKPARDGEGGSDQPGTTLPGYG